jgi:hypothetical protein
MDDDDALLQLLDAASVPEKRARPSSTIKSLAGKRSTINSHEWVD